MSAAKRDSGRNMAMFLGGNAPAWRSANHPPSVSSETVEIDKGKTMSIKTKLMLITLFFNVLSACAASTPPNLTAYQRNVGPGSSVDGRPSSDVGRGTPGDEDVPGVATGRSVFGN